MTAKQFIAPSQILPISNYFQLFGKFIMRLWILRETKKAVREREREREQWVVPFHSLPHKGSPPHLASSYIANLLLIVQSSEEFLRAGTFLTEQLALSRGKELN